MKTIILLFLLISASLFANSQVIKLTFSALNNGQQAGIDSIRIINLDQGGDTMLYWPDSVLLLGYVGNPEIEGKTVEGFSLHLIASEGETDMVKIKVTVPEEGLVELVVFDLSGKMLKNSLSSIRKGMHLISFTPPKKGFYVVTARWKTETRSVKLVYSGR
ncbi:MAG: T9SS type A sorting domain-containing protein, partial [Bacteroidetes bacterium]|nr:T9SS type A sorting domain-containing protein [Bacteroidota bacterium]